MTPYPRAVEQTMRTFFASLREHDRRRYAAVEAAKLGHGGIAYISQVLGIDPKTIRQGQRDLADLPERPAFLYSLEVLGAGHDFDALITDIRLVAE